MDVKTKFVLLKGSFVINQIFWVKVVYTFIKEFNQLQTKNVNQTEFINTLLNHVDPKAVLEDLTFNEEFKKMMDDYKP